jgi:hypothetical protein
MGRKEVRDYFRTQRISLTTQERQDRKKKRNQENRQKHLYENSNEPIPDIKARIAEAIAQAEQTQRNIDALTEGEMK